MSCNLELKDLTITTSTTKKTLVKGISLYTVRGGITAILGQSGSGKTTICLSVMGLLPKGLTARGKILLNDGNHSINLLKLKENELHRLRGRKIAITFQEPKRYLNPIIKCGKQLMDLVNVPRAEKPEKALNLLKIVKFENPGEIFNKYPFELSGGQAQKFSLALALAGNPAILLADEPTTGLDYESKKELEAIYNDRIERDELSILLVTHDIYFARRIADFVGIILNGHLIEFGSKKEVFSSPLHPYTKQLIEATSLEKLNSAVDNIQEHTLLSRSDGCIFSLNCKYSLPECFKNEPPAYRIGKRMVRCYLFLERRKEYFTTFSGE